MKKKTPKRRVDVLFLRDLPADLKLQFKAYCAVRGVSMKAKIIQYMLECAREDFERESRRNK
jgi:hypothetical protein